MPGSDIGIDLGTATVLINVRGKGIVLREPSVVAMDKNTDEIVAIGEQARKMLGRTPGNIVAVRPLRDGVISDYDLTQQMLKYFIRRVGAHFLFRPRIMVCVPSRITEVEERAVIDAATDAGARKTYLIEEPVAAAIGAGIDISRPNGNMVVDIGGGTTDIAVLSLKDIAVSASVRVAGDKFNEAVVRYIRKKYDVLIGERTAEDVKIRIGSVLPEDGARSMPVKGRSLISGLPKMFDVTSAEICEAFREPAAAIFEAVHSVLESTPPELVGDISDNGILLTGGGALLDGFDRLLAKRTGIPVRVADDPVSCVAKGTGKALERLGELPEGLLSISKNQNAR